MKRGLIVFGVLLLSVATYAVVNSTVTSESRRALTSEIPELSWLKREYALTNDQYEEIKSLHFEHDQTCQSICKSLYDTRTALERAIANHPLESEIVQNALTTWREQQITSQNSILMHMEDVSRCMAPEQAKRYRLNIYHTLILPGRAPHINSDGDFDAGFNLYFK